MKFSDHAETFACAGEKLVGISSLPERPSPVGVVVIVGGPQYRAGSHRQFVLLARALAAAGHAVLRFDYRGMGDSSGAQRGFEDVSADIAAAIACLRARVGGLDHVVLWGLCDGASAALLYCEETQDARVAGLCLLNPWVRSPVSQARAQVKHYYGRRLMQREFWIKLLRGGVSADAFSGFVESLRTSRRSPKEPVASFQQRMATACNARPGRPLLLLLSGDDYTAKEFIEYTAADAAWHSALRQPGVRRHDIAAADHTFSNPDHAEQVERLTIAWLDELAAATSGPASAARSVAAPQPA